MDPETGEPLPRAPHVRGPTTSSCRSTRRTGVPVLGRLPREGDTPGLPDEEEIEGVRVYRFKQTIEPTDIDLQASRGESEFTSVPGSLVGRPDKPSVKTNRMYSNVRTLWIEPETGVIVKAEEEQLTTSTWPVSPSPRSPR
jgi:hypothetical protein